MVILSSLSMESRAKLKQVYSYQGIRRSHFLRFQNLRCSQYSSVQDCITLDAMGVSHAVRLPRLQTSPNMWPASFSENLGFSFFKKMDSKDSEISSGDLHRILSTFCPLRLCTFEGCIFGVLTQLLGSCGQCEDPPLPLQTAREGFWHFPLSTTHSHTIAIRFCHPISSPLPLL